MNTCPTKVDRIKSKKLLEDSLKRCCKCGNVKNLSDFYKESRSTSGYRGRCKECSSTINVKTIKLQEEKEYLYEQGLKLCSKCKEIKEIKLFYKNKRLKFGLASWCIVCTKLYKKENRESIYKKELEYRKKHKIRLDRLRKKYNEERRDSIYRQRKAFRSSKCHNALLISKINKKDPRYKAKFVDNTTVLKCYYCKKEYAPTNIEIQHFLTAKDGMKNIYCSDRCKEACTEFGFNPTRHIDPRSIRYVEAETKVKVRNCQTNHLKQLQIDDVGYNYCEKCGAKGKVDLHHTLEVAKFGLKSINSSGHLLVCVKCHKELNISCK